MLVRIGELAALLGGELLGDAGIAVNRIRPFDTAGPDSITFVSNVRLQSRLPASPAACVIVGPALRDAAAARGAAIVCADPYLAYARLTQWWAAQQRSAPPAGVHPTAVVEPGAVVHASAVVGALAYVGIGARIGAHAVVGAHSHVGASATVGDGTRLLPQVTLADGCSIGARCTVHSGAVLGADGFGFAPDGAGGWVKIEQLGAVVIGDDVDIGANTCIDRGALDDTVIEDGVKLDNLIQIAHNVRIGAHTAMAGCAGVAGSTTIGRHCSIGGAAMIYGHIVIADHVFINAATVVSKSIHQAGMYSGHFPMDENARWEKNAATLKQLYSMRERLLRALEGKDMTAPALDIHRILKKLPHRYPFLLVDRVLDIERGVRIKALKNVSINEPFFSGHFPIRPVMPGVLMLEALAQTAALLSFESMDSARDDDTVVYFVGIDGARFKRPVEPGDQLILEATMDRAKAGIYKFITRATVDGELAVTAELMCTMRKVV